MANWQLKSVKWWHETLIDWMIANPHLTLRDAAKFFDCSALYVGMLIRSDMFRARLTERQEALSSAVLSDIKDRIHSIGQLSMNVIEEKLRKTPVSHQSLDAVRKVAEMALNASGHAAPRGGGGQVQINIGVAPEVLVRAREKLMRLQQLEAQDSGNTLGYTSPQPVALPAPEVELCAESGVKL